MITLIPCDRFWLDTHFYVIYFEKHGADYCEIKKIKNIYDYTTFTR